MRTWGVLAAILLSYVATSRFPLRAPWEPGWSAVDRAIPFVGSAFYVYASYYVLLVGGLFSLKGPELDRTLREVLSATAAASAVFILFPVAHPPTPVPEGGVARLIHAFLTTVDTSTNTFPSLHAALGLLVAWGVARARPAWGRWPVLWAWAAAASTVLTKRHFAADLAGGVALALACRAWGREPLRDFGMAGNTER